MRISVILIITVFSALICLALLLLLIDINLRTQYLLEKTILENKSEEFESTEIKQLKSQVISVNEILEWISSAQQEKFYLCGNIEKLSAIIPFQLDISNISYREQNNEISLSGFSPEREFLLELKERLEEENSFKNVYFPPSTWVDAIDIDFLVKFNVD